MAKQDVLDRLLEEQLRVAHLDEKKHPQLRANIRTAFEEVDADHPVVANDLKSVLKKLAGKAQLDQRLITETVRTVIEESDRALLRASVHALLKKLKPHGFRLTDEDVSSVIQRYRLRSNTSFAKITKAVHDYYNSPRNVEDITPEEIRRLIRHELEKRGPVDARHVNAIFRQHQRQADPEQQFSLDDIRKLIQQSKQVIGVAPTTPSPDANQALLQKKRKLGDNANGFVAPPAKVETGTRYKKTFFDQVRTKMQRYGLRPLTKQARNWLTDSIRKAASPSQQQLFRRSVVESSMSGALIGKMFLYAYDAKLKDELPFWDAFPLIFVVEVYKDGWLGINLHYLPMRLRLQLFDALLGLANDSSLDKVQRLRLGYRLLKGFSEFPLVRPCIKRYLATHVESSLLEVKPIDWETAVFLPCEQFQKASNETVWADSREKARKYRGK
jgi:hypothetical protein